MDRFDSISELHPQRGSALPAAGSENDGPTLHSTGPPATEQSSLRLQKAKPYPPGQRKDGERPTRPSDIAITSSANDGPHPYTLVEPASPPRGTGVPVSAGRRASSPFVSAASPSSAFRSASPRHLSPATSQIFERDVQESTVMGPELSPAIPSHIQTEDHIPPVLEASSLAITDKQLNPDEVEIVTHSEHRPAAVAVAASTLNEAQTQAYSSHNELGIPSQDHEETASTYGAVDPTDPRRLSFISFADVVHAENVETGKESSHLVSPNSLIVSGGGGRSPSPIRSPLSDRVPASPPTSGSASLKATESSPVRGGPSSATSVQGYQHGELTIETMRQTLQKTGSNEPGVQPPTPV